MNDTRTGATSEVSLPRRSFLRGIAGGALGAVVGGGAMAKLALAQPADKAAAPAGAGIKLPPLPYDYDALEPHIDALTMKIHHDKHHQAYITNLNTALKGHPELAALLVDDLLMNLDKLPEAVRMAIRNNGGGHVNHTLFWTVMGPDKGGEPGGKLADAVKATFGSFAEFKKNFSQAAMTRFGSGWAWLSVDGQGKLSIESLPNQDSPVSLGRRPILGLDVWEHAYYLKYKNMRADYVNAWWNVVNWDAVSKRYAAAT